ncbi:MAG TPA: hypothetical protein VL463_27395 [Kofleriaceae bacterium]|nr:hypothetical protein [Kofleriaceae bacterium]
MSASETIEIEGLALLMSTSEAIAVCESHGWEHTIRPEDGRYTYAPPLPALIVAAVFESGKIVSLEATYKPPTKDQAERPLALLPIQREGSLLGKPWRAAWADDRRVVIVSDGEGERTIAVHLGVIAEEREVRAYLATFGPGLQPPARA